MDSSYAIKINNIPFTPNPNIQYKNDYIKLATLKSRPEYWDRFMPDTKNLTPEMVEKITYRYLVLNDLWFVLYFVLGIPIANHAFAVNKCKLIESGPQTMTLDIWS